MKRIYRIKVLIMTGIIAGICFGCTNKDVKPENQNHTEQSSVMDTETEQPTAINTETEQPTVINTETEQPEDMNTTTEEETPVTDKEKNSMNMLNHITVLSQEINSSKTSKIYLEQAYLSIVNNFNPNMIDERTLGELNSLMDLLEEYRMIAEKRDRLEFVYEQNKAKAIRDAVPDPLTILNVITAKGGIKKLIAGMHLVVSSGAEYLNSKNQAEMEFLEKGWELDDEESKALHIQRKGIFNYMVNTVNENGLEGKAALTEELVDTLVEWQNNENVSARIRFLETNTDTYKNSGDFWLLLARSYYENEEYEKCIEAVKEYENLNICIFRKDFGYAEILPLAIVSAQEIMSTEDYVKIIPERVTKIIENTKSDQWSLRYFAAQIYLELYARTEKIEFLKASYNITLNNINSMVGKQHELNQTYLKEIVQAKADKDAASEVKDEIQAYNKMIEEKRKTELAPIYEPLLLNCDLLSVILSKLDLSEEEKTELSEIMYMDDKPLFLVEELNNIYKLKAAKTDVTDIPINLDGDEIRLPAAYITDQSDITMVITDRKDKRVIDDWEIREVNRKEGNTVEDFMVLYESEKADKFKYKKGQKITITIDVKPGSRIEKLKFNYMIKEKKRWWIIPDKIIFERI